ncbi:HMA2 domain-containing protein [Thermosynechococcus sp.]|uniref:HMA2 domain-containing protein n=1 Tax=Thermosynechococcus sp. TaxID=2814275 RepID=UPI00391DCAAE
MATAKTAPIAEVMHLTGDRLRLRIQQLKTDAAFRDPLSAYLKALQGIKSVHVNPLAA